MDPLRCLLMNVKPEVSAYKIFAKCQKLQKAPRAVYDLKALMIFCGNQLGNMIRNWDLKWVQKLII